MPPSPWRGRLAVAALATGLFAIVTTEILPIGLLTAIGADFGVSPGAAGLTMTMPGLVAAVAAPVVTVATGRLDRRAMLGVFMLLLALAGFLGAVAPEYWVLLAARVLVGVTIGGFWSIGAGLAPRLVGPRAAPAATSVVFAAVPLGSVLGVPAGTVLGELAGWRTAVAALGVLGLAVFAALAATTPRLPADGSATTWGVLAALARRKGTRAALMLTVTIVLAHLGTYTYVTPLLHDVGVGDVATYLLVYGGAGVVGNFLAGWAVPRSPRATFATAAAAIALATVALPMLHGAGTLAALMIWGLAYGAVPVCSQSWFARAAPDAPEGATVLFTSSFQATMAAGAFLGGLVVDATSPSALMMVGGVVAMGGVVGVKGVRVGAPGRTAPTPHHSHRTP
ncbi:MFS transporter [Phytomonospora endophytica]|uniref:Putative MFS family arabinose efflux permease n=1 Tax=Phytomonospora endophytica TaxID=714109 RepID=A0A841FHN3_9ACTN|nr:MFS transporter [Phytomonospora endophytica]MBB6033082.1 putative MFS family arabinose efflux permease [Phytomonospora endophytica]GIG65309.1 MFS transporter [Phytomonospora endophytica]